MPSYNRNTVIVSSLTQGANFLVNSGTSSLLLSTNTLSLIVPDGQFFIGIFSISTNGLANNFNIWCGIEIRIGTTYYLTSGNESVGSGGSGYSTKAYLGPGTYSVVGKVGAENTSGFSINIRHGYSGFLYQTVTN